MLTRECLRAHLRTYHRANKASNSLSIVSAITYPKSHIQSPSLEIAGLALVQSRYITSLHHDRTLWSAVAKLQRNYNRCIQLATKHLEVGVVFSQLLSGSEPIWSMNIGRG